MPVDLTHGFQFASFVAEPLKGGLIGADQRRRHLPPKAMAVLVSLAEVAPEPLTRESLIDKVWGESCVSDEVLTHAITELRHALNDSPSKPKYIQTIPKRGYCLIADVRPIGSPGQPQAGNDREFAVGRSVVRGFDAIRRNPVSSTLVFCGFAGALVAVYYLQDGQDDEPVVSDGVPAAPGMRHTFVHSEAHELMLRAQFLERRTTRENAREAEILLEQALSIDPNSASAWALLGRIYYRQASLFRSRSLQEGSELAREAIQRALGISPRYGPAHADLALIIMTFDFDFETAFEHLRHAQDTDPANPHVLRVAAKLEMTHGHVEHAVDMLERAVSMDPYSCMVHTDLGQAYYFANRLEEAEAELQGALQLNPDVVRAHYFLGLVRVASHSLELALAAMEKEPDEGLRMAGLAVVRYAMDYADSSDEALEATTRSNQGPRAYRLATAYAFRGQRDEALDWLEVAYEQKDGEMIYLLVEPLLANLHTEARWKRLVEKLGLPRLI